MSCTIYFIRHGETEHNVLGLIQGHSDSPLTEEGKPRELLDKVYESFGKFTRQQRFLFTIDHFASPNSLFKKIV